jgi:DNA repair exonuclease SbcCD nuclease subunit
MTAPYLLVSDLHCHAWSAFASRNEDGVNSRLHMILQEFLRAAGELRAAGGRRIVVAGDVFHVRGSIDPEVFNPTFSVFERLADQFEIVLIPGNHDLKGKEVSALGNAFSTFDALDSCRIAIEPMVTEDLALVPWIQDQAELKKAILALHDDIGDDRGRQNRYDLILHAPVNEVLTGLPPHGLDPDWLADLGFRRVFSGHYHNRKQIRPNVWSIGATTHQTWSDIGTKAGFMLVYPDKVIERASWAPSFVEITAETDPDEVPLIVDGNYVRVRTKAAGASDVNKVRDELLGMGALGVVMQVIKEAATARATTPRAGTGTIETSIAEWIKERSDDWAVAEADVLAGALEILSEARAV